MAEDSIPFLLAELQRLDGGKPPSTSQTHISVILLGETLAWKIKKAVNLEYAMQYVAARRRIVQAG